MDSGADSLQLRCGDCQETQLCGPAKIDAHLRRAGMLRSEQTPEIEILHELLRAAAGAIVCSSCGSTGLLVEQPAEDDDETWGGSRKCEGCRKPIPTERIAALPQVRYCAECQSASERGESLDEVEYCSRCGAVMEVRQTRGAGITRYVMACTECGR
jgi:hypothetical protein